MKLVAVLTALVVAPPMLAVGWAAKPAPAPPGFGEYVQTTLQVKHVPGQDTDDWLAVATTGPNKGGAIDLVQALSVYRTHKDLEDSAQGKVEYREMKCSDYTSGAAKHAYLSASFVRKCSSVKKTRKQAEEFMLEVLAPEPKS